MLKFLVLALLVAAVFYAFSTRNRPPPRDDGRDDDDGGPILPTERSRLDRLPDETRRRKPEPVDGEAGNS
jgi:hypothetical protein